MATKTHEPDHGRVAARGVNQLKRKHSPEGLQRLRESALRIRPWQNTRGPITPEGKAKVAENGRYAQKGAVSRRQMRKVVAEAHNLLTQMAAVRRLACPDEPVEQERD
jgi:hypothetical protein